MKSALKRKRHTVAIIVPENPRLDRANFCTYYLQQFEKALTNWADLASILIEVEQDKLYEEIGFKTWDEWAKKNGPACHRLCYAVKARYKSLRAAGLSDADLKLIPPETAQWASRAKNISPAALSKPEVKEALMLPKQKAIKMLQEVVPEQHCENTVRFTCIFAVSQHEVIAKAYQTFRMVKDEHASMADFIEYAVSELILSWGKS